MLIPWKRKDSHMIDTLPLAETQLPEGAADSGAMAARRDLIQLVLAETQPVGERVFGGSDPGTRTRARTLLSLLTYCYAADILPSEDIQWASANEVGARYLCAGTIFHRESIREFRRANRPWIEESLAQVLNAQSVDHGAKAASVARRKIELAVMMDTAMCD
jgi:hypothetical protein